MVTGGEEVVTEIEVTRIEVGMTAIITETDGEGVEDIEVEMMATGETGRRGLHPLLLIGVTTLKVAVTATTTAGRIMRMQGIERDIITRWRERMRRTLMTAGRKG